MRQDGDFAGASNGVVQRTSITIEGKQTKAKISVKKVKNKGEVCLAGSSGRAEEMLSLVKLVE